MYKIGEIMQKLYQQTRYLILVSLVFVFGFGMTGTLSPLAVDDKPDRLKLAFSQQSERHTEHLAPDLWAWQPYPKPDPAAVEALNESNKRFVQDTQPRILKDVQVSASLSPLNDHSESQLAVNPNNPLHMVGGSKFFTDPANYVFKDGSYTTFDGGKTWLQQLVPGYEKWTITSDPVVAIDDQGNAYYAVLTANKTVSGCRTSFQGSGMFVSTSRDGGLTWEEPVAVHLSAPPGLGDDKQWIAADWHPNSPYRGHVYLVWDLFTDTEGGVAFARSTDRGKSFEPFKFIGGLDDAFLGPQIDIAPNGDIYVVWVNFSASSLDWVKSSDGGVTFSKPARAVSISPMPGTLPNGTWRNVTLPTFAVSPKTGTLLLSWADFRNGDTDIYFARSADGGQTWSSGALPQNGRVNDDPLRDGIDQFQPAIAVSRAGEIGLAWYDRRLTKNTLIDVFQAISRDDGNTFQANTRVTSVSFDGDVNPAYPKSGSCTVTFIGDYIGMAAGADGFYPFWTDTRTGVQEIFSVNSTGVAQTEELVYTNSQPVRDLAFDPKGVLHFSEASGAQANGRIHQLTQLDTLPTKSLRQDVELSQISGFWGGNFGFDANGNLWLSNGAHPGALYTQQNESFVNFYSNPNNPINGFQIRDAQLYFASAPNSIFALSLPLNPSQSVASLVYASVARLLVSDLALGSDGKLFFIDSSEAVGTIYQVIANQEVKFFARLGSSVNGLAIDLEGRLWFTNEQKIFRLSPPTKRVSTR
jgi:hypothetical protein